LTLVRITKTRGLAPGFLLSPIYNKAKKYLSWYDESMIRTRDFLLFVVILLFLLVGISGTLIHERLKVATGVVGEVNFKNDSVELSVSSNREEDNKAANLARLRAKLAVGEQISVPDIDTVVAPPTPINLVVINRQAIYCPSLKDTTQLKSTWPKNVAVREVEGARMVYEQVTQMASSATSTAPNITEIPRLQLSVNQVRESQDTCINSDVIGITTTGALITNDAASRYIGVSELTLIGFALDGLPIYGVKTDTSKLDSCGGESGPLGYRYHLRPGEDFVLGCFASTPTTFLNF